MWSSRGDPFHDCGAILDGWVGDSPDLRYRQDRPQYELLNQATEWVSWKASRRCARATTSPTFHALELATRKAEDKFGVPLHHRRLRGTASAGMHEDRTRERGRRRAGHQEGSVLAISAMPLGTITPPSSTTLGSGTVAALPSTGHTVPHRRRPRILTRADRPSPHPARARRNSPTPLVSAPACSC